MQNERKYIRNEKYIYIYVSKLKFSNFYIANSMVRVRKKKYI